MRLSSNSFADGQPIPADNAFGRFDPATHVTLSENQNPHLAWDEVPEGARSFVLICCDPDVPSRGDDVNKEGRTVPADLPRVDFYHWVLVDIPASTRTIGEGAHADGVIPRGKPGPDAGGMRHGPNDYTGWFAGDPSMSGTYYGYDGPCPPWNDSIVHHYRFTIYALDVERCPIEGPLTGPRVREAIEGHVLAEATLTGTYAINPEAVLRD